MRTSTRFRGALTRALPFAALACIGACAHSEPPAPQRPAAKPLEQAPAAAAPAAEAATAPAPPTPVPEGDTIESYMFEHFAIANYARDALITGRIGPVRRALGALSEHRYEDVSPGEWRPWIAKLQLAAKPAATAETIEDAARAVANTAAVCGECHQARGAGPHFPEDYDPDSEMGLSNSVFDRMERHVWAANRMWEGLIAPSDRAWRAGSAELANVPLKAPRRNPPLSAAFSADLRSLRELGDQARSMLEPAERAQAYARFLVRCAQCHQREGTTL